MSEVFEQASVSLILADFAVADQLGKLFDVTVGAVELRARDYQGLAPEQVGVERTQGEGRAIGGNQ